MPNEINPCSGGDCVAAFVYDDGSLDLYSTRRPNSTTFIDADEWEKFVAEVRQGLWDHTVRRNPQLPVVEGAA